jgi:hypothetical protein
MYMVLYHLHVFLVYIIRGPNGRACRPLAAPCFRGRRRGCRRAGFKERKRKKELLLQKN